MDNSIKEELRYYLWIFVFAITIGFIVYGMKIFNYSIGIDSDIYLQNTNDMLFSWHLKEGRFGLTLIWLLLPFLHSLNVCGANFIAMFTLALSAVEWCYLIKRYDKSVSDLHLLFFVIFYMASTVWMEIIYFTYMAIQCMIGVALIPVSVFYMWEGIKNNKKKWLSVSVILLTVSISTYQVIAALFLAGFLMVVYIEEKESQWIDCLKSIFKVLALIVVSLSLYYVTNLLVSHLIFKVGFADGFTDILGIKTNPIAKLRSLVYFTYYIFVGNGNLTNTILTRAFCVDNLTWRGSIMFAIAFIVVFANMMKRTREKRRTMVIPLVGMWCCVYAPAILGVGGAPDRYIHALPLVSAFFVYEMLKISETSSRTWKILVLSATVIFSFRFCWNSCMLSEADVVEYKGEVALCADIHQKIVSVWNDANLKYESDNSDRPLLILGKYDYVDECDYPDHSILGVPAMYYGGDESKIEATLRTIPFMNAIGYNYIGIETTDKRLDDLRRYAENMPSYPNDGYVKIVDGVTIVKLSDMVYAE